MKVIVYIALFLFTSHSMLFGQDLVPFNKNNLYGVIDSLQKVVVEPLFDEILIHNEYGIIAGKLDGIWFFYNLLGKKLVKSNFRSYKINSMHGVYVGNEFVPTSHLLEIREKYGGPRYVLNPFTSEVEPKLLQVDVTCKFEKTWFHELSAAEIGILKITLENGRINFMDTTGNLLSPVWFSSGYLVGRDFMAIDTGGGLLALYSLDFEKRSDFLYDRILGSYNLDYFLADNLSSNGVRTYCLLDTLGRIVFESPQPIKIVDEHFVIVNNEKSGLYSYEGKPVFEYENSFLDYLVADLTKFKIVRSNKTGIVDNKGNIILEPVYKDIFTTSGKYFIATKQNSAGLLDEKFKEIFFMDSIQISLADDFPGFFPAWKSVLNKGRKGLLDSLGRIVIPFEYENIL